MRPPLSGKVGAVGKVGSDAEVPSTAAAASRAARRTGAVPILPIGPEDVAPTTRP